jgi:hypothetical protein
MKFLSSAPIEAAHWIAPRLGAPGVVGSLVPSGFDSYIRLLNPVDIPWPGSGTTTWSAVAKQLAFHLDADTGWQDIETEHGNADEIGEPESGTIPAELATGLTEVLRAAAAPDTQFFAMMWPGYGGVPQTESNTLSVGPETEMCVLTGDLLTAASGDSDRIPVHWWPDDRAWYLGGDVYGRSVYLGASVETTTKLLTQFEGFAVTLDTRVPFEP